MNKITTLDELLDAINKDDNVMLSVGFGLHATTYDVDVNAVNKNIQSLGG